MNKKIIFLSLLALLINSKLMSSDFVTKLRMDSLYCTIKYDNEIVGKDQRIDSSHPCFDPIPAELIYVENKRLAVLHQTKILQHVKMSEKKWSRLIEKLRKEDFDIQELKSGKKYALKKSLCLHILGNEQIAMQKDNNYALYYLIKSIRLELPSKIKAEQEHNSDKKWLAGIAIGIPVGMTILGLGALYALLYMAKNFHYR